MCFLQPGTVIIVEPFEREGGKLPIFQAVLRDIAWAPGRRGHGDGDADGDVSMVTSGCSF